MGDQKVSLLSGKRNMQRFTKFLLKDMRALEYMLDHDWFETDVQRIGAEQEMVLVDGDTLKPHSIIDQVMPMVDEYPWLDTELANFNLETNLSPRVFEGSCFSDLHKENSDRLNLLQSRLEKYNSKIVLTGILPTIRKFDLELHNLTPLKRYHALMEALTEQREAQNFELRLTGIDEIKVKHDSPLLEACNTSFQVHLQVTPDNFVKMYNIAQALAGPMVAIGANSPIVFGKRLWHESRIALFQQAIDTRSTKDHMREKSPRVSFGKQWLQDSIMEIYQEDITRFRILLGNDIKEDSERMIQEGNVPKLRALQIHNGTVYRWNRPCYGISENGKPHLRIENRVLPAGPTTIDEIANACFWLGCMEGMALETEDLTKRLKFEYAKDNFGKAARYGAETKFLWLDHKEISCQELILDRLLPIARKGLQHRNVKEQDIEKYLGVIEGRARNLQTGAKWLIRTYTDLLGQTSKDEALTTLVSCLIDYQKSGTPVHEWETGSLSSLASYRPASLLVSEFMITDLFTVQQDDLLELVAEMMQWKHLRYVPVEDKHGTLVGLISDRLILADFLRKKKSKRRAAAVKDIMVSDLITIGPDATIIKAMEIMREKKIGCLPVVIGNELVGMITTMELLNVSGRLIERLRKGEE